jgi:phage terminase small subunit
MKKYLTSKQRLFCHYYVVDGNATRAYRNAYIGCKTDNSAAAASVRLLRNVKILEYIKIIEGDIEKRVSITKIRVLLELAKIAFSTVAHLHNTWISLKKFEDLTDDQKSAIESTETEVQTKMIDKEVFEVVKIKIKLYNKLSALAEINKMMGYYATDKIEVTQKDDTRGKSTDELKERLEVLRQLKKANDGNNGNIN